MMHIQSADRWDLRDASSLVASPGMKEKEFESGAAADSSSSLSHLSLPSPLPTQTEKLSLEGENRAWAEKAETA